MLKGVTMCLLWALPLRSAFIILSGCVLVIQEREADAQQTHPAVASTANQAGNKSHSEGL